MAPNHLEALAEPAEAATPHEAPEHYKHPKFGVGVLLRREVSGLRIRFESGERVIAVGRVERI